MSQFPNQRLTEAQKIKKYGSLEDWAATIYNSIRSISGMYSEVTTQLSYRETRVLRNLYNGVLDLEDFEYVLRPYGEYTPDYPSELRHYDRISPKIHLLVGEEIKRPFNHKAVAINPEAVTQYELKVKERILQALEDQILRGIEDEGGVPPGTALEESQIPKTPQQILQNSSTDLQSDMEIQANRALQYFKEYLNIKEIFNKGWEDLLVEGNDIYYTGISNNEPLLRRVDGEYFDYDRAHTTEYIEDAQWALEERWMPVSQVYDEFWEFLKEEDFEKIEKMKGTYKQNIGYGSGIPVIYMRDVDYISGGNRDREVGKIGSNSVVKVVHFCWKSLRKIGFVVYQDPETGDLLEKTVDETYKKQPEDLEIEWKWINEVWEATRIGKELTVGVRARPNQYKNLDNPSKCRLPYTGIIKPQLSLVRRIKDIQYLYDIIMYRKELTVAQAKGRKMIMDTSQIPQTEGWNMKKWLYYFDTAGIVFINSMQEGSGVFQGQSPSFNQFSDIDLTLSNSIQQYILILEKLDQLMEDITGVSRQRQGNVHQQETVGGVERAVVQSSAVTEYLFYQHNRVKKRVLTNLLEEAKLAWLEGKKTQYLMDDLTRQIINIDGDIFNSAEYGVMVTDSEKENRVMQFIEQNAMAAVQAGQAQLKDVVAALRSESIANAERIITKAAQEVQQQQQQLAQQEQEAARQLQQERIAAETEAREDEQAHKLDEINLKGEWDIRKEEIKSFIGQQDQDINNNNIPDQLEIEKLRQKDNIDNRKLDIEYKKLQQKDKEIRIKEKQANSKPKKE